METRCLPAPSGQLMTQENDHRLDLLTSDPRLARFDALSTHALTAVALLHVRQDARVGRATEGCLQWV